MPRRLALYLVEIKFLVTKGNKVFLLSDKNGINFLSNLGRYNKDIYLKFGKCQFFQLKYDAKKEV
ncbi:hypothetical protein AFL42_16245 [Oceanobacillus caeni]|uniref:Uncharacterized protein n=1 Tax=Oceanobacillus caeni TaxID=405946 RepID=A0ABR5MFP7_9BACI|nr:hypothetical protein AFL42_16245 [Oceanobacillus caeni]